MTWNHCRKATLHVLAFAVVVVFSTTTARTLSENVLLTVILRGRAGYELIYITNEAVGRVGYYQLISGKSEKNNCFSNFSSNSRDFFGWNLSKSWHFLYRRRREKIFSDLQNFTTTNSPSVFLIWSNLTIMAHIMGLGNQSESWKIIIMS